MERATSRQDYHNSNQHSPLGLFSEAKETINKLFLKLDDNITRVNQFFSNRDLDPEINDDSVTKKLASIQESVKAITCIITRNQMKVAFFGLCSNGKSTVINAILHDRVLPSGFGHTTACFLQIQGSPTDQAYMEIDCKGQTLKKSLNSLGKDVNALEPGALEHSSLVKVFWPVSKCPLLKYDVVLVDSPGINLKGDLDECIDKHCKDADVFVLVSNAVSSLIEAEKEFFHKVNEKLSNPIIFILNNQWDRIASERDQSVMDKVRTQHVNKGVQFLSDELKITGHDEAKDMIFFVSASETLNERSPSNQTWAKNEWFFNHRQQEFIDFEMKFEQSLSRSAVQTKFKKHIDRGLLLIRESLTLMENTKATIGRRFKSKDEQLAINKRRMTNITDRFDREKLYVYLDEMKRHILMMINDAFDKEISKSNLGQIVEQFDLRFSLTHIEQYKQQLYKHVEENLNEHLQIRIRNVITKGFNPIKDQLGDISKLLSEERQLIVKDIMSSELTINDELFSSAIFRQSITGFQEDLEFRFSLGLFTIMRKIQNMISPSSINKSTNNNHNDVTIGSNTPYKFHDRSLQADSDVISIVERFLLTSPQSPSTIGSLAFGGLLVRTVGWRIILGATMFYGAMYAYEYMTWTNKAKEKTFKTQYRKYAERGLSQVSKIITLQIASSVEKRMETLEEKFTNEVGSELKQLSSEIGSLSSSLRKLEECQKFVDEICNQSDVLMGELLEFAKTFFN